MFKSIENNLLIGLILLFLSLAAASSFFTLRLVNYGIIASSGIVLSLIMLINNYRKFNKNILFLLDALENEDYSFHFSENKMSKRERELNRMLNRIKKVLLLAHQEMIHNEAFLSVIVENIPTGILITDQKGLVRNINQSALKLLGLNSLVHLNQLRNIDDSFPSLFKNLHPGKKLTLQIQNERESVLLSVQTVEVFASGEKVRVITLSNIENEMEAKEMESWMRLIRVITHEIMNSIGPIVSLSEALLYSFHSFEKGKVTKQLWEKTTDGLDIIHKTAQSLSSFVESYRRLTRVPEPKITQVKIDSLLEKITNLFAEELKQKQISIEIINQKETVLYGDESQIFQILMNLIKNATEAFSNINSEPSSRHIRIIVHQNVAQTNIHISDNGLPIPSEIVPQLFVPFFSTKKEGSGIGLSLSRYIMRLHGGSLRYTQENEWTTFTLIFPNTATTITEQKQLTNT